MITLISLPINVVRMVGDILEEAGFEVASGGGGTVEMEREGAITDTEAKELTQKMAEKLFVFDVFEEEEEE